MYKRDAILTQRHAQASPDGLADVITFVLLTIRQPIEKVPDACEDVAALGSESRFLSRVKRQGREYAYANAEDLHERMLALRPYHKHRTELLLLFREVPGLDLVKSGFVCQLACGVVGCLDTHNLKRFDLDARAFQTSGLRNEETIRARALHYIDTCDRMGGVESLWDSWCAFVAARRPGTFKAQGDLFDLGLRGADLVSALHVVSIAKLSQR